jgi:hypothetical protein
MSNLSYADLFEAYCAWKADWTGEPIPFMEWCARLGEPGTIQ